MSVLSAEIGADSRVFGEYVLCHNGRKNPIGIERGAEVTADLSEGMPGFNVEQYFSSQPTIYADYDHVVTAYAHPHGRAIGLLGARWLGSTDCRFLYLWTAMIAHSYRRSLLFGRILSFFFENVGGSIGGGVPAITATKTYNPIVYSIFKSVAQAVDTVDVYPVIPADEQPVRLVQLAERVSRGISSSLVLRPSTGVVVGGQAMVAPDFFPHMEESRDDVVTEHFRAHLTRADQVLCILLVPPNAQEKVFVHLTSQSKPECRTHSERRR